MNYSMIDPTERDYSDWSVIADDIMFNLIRRGEPFSADNWFEQARSHQMPPCLIKKLSGGKFREFQAAGYIRKRTDYKLSERNGGATLPLWEKA